MSAIDDSSLAYIAMNCKYLEFLDISETQVSNVSLAILGNNVGTLRELYLDDCKNIGNEELTCLYPMTKLECLSLQHNHSITQYGIIQLVTRVPSLRRLNVSLCSQLSDVSVMKAKSLNTSLDIEYHFKPKIRSKSFTFQ